MIIFKPKKSKKSKRSNDKNKDKSKSVVTKQQRKHFRSLSIEQMNGATYSWQIRRRHDLIEGILNAKNKQKFTSDRFKVGELEFCLELYPNGYDENSVGLTDLFLKLCHIPNEWTEVWINYRLFCNETLSSWTFIQKFKKGGFWGWHDGCLLFHDLKKEILSTALSRSRSITDEEEEEEEEETYEESYESDTDGTVKKHSSTDLLSPFGDDYVATKFGDIAITFSSFIQILRANSKHKNTKTVGSHSKRNKKIVYEKNLLYSNEYHFKLEWKINNDLLQKFISCQHGKYYESEIFYEMWNLRVSPNGCNYQKENGGNLTLFLNLCCLPPKISRIKVKYALYEAETGTKWKFTRDFSYSASLSGWPDGKLLTTDLKHLKTLKFMANIYIVKMYDMKGKHIDIHHNENLTAINEDEQIGLDGKQISTEHTKSPSPTSTQNIMQSIAQRNGETNASELSIINNTPISPTISPAQQQTHTHNITINNPNNNSTKEYKELETKMNVIENKIDALTDCVSAVQRQMNQLSSNIEYIKQKQIKDDEYRDNMMFILNEMRKDIQNVYKSQQHNNIMNVVPVRTKSGSPLAKYNNEYIDYDNHLLCVNQNNNLDLRRPKSARSALVITPYNSNMSSNENENYKINTKYKRKKKQTSNNKLKARKLKARDNNNNNNNKKKKKKKKESPHLSQRDYLRKWLTNNVKLPQYFDVFIENGVEDLRMIMDLTINELKMIGIHQKAHQLQIQKEITRLRNQMQKNNTLSNSLGSSLFDTV